MTVPGVIEAEGKGLCQLCLAHEETRPYGPKGEEICFACGQKNPAQTEAAMAAFLFNERCSL